MDFAPQQTVMHLSEITTIYLAIGAPFGVHYVFQHKVFNRNLFLKAFIITFLWPLIIVRYFAGFRTRGSGLKAKNRVEKKSELIKRKLFTALSEIQMQIIGLKEVDNIERLVCVIRENAEKYLGLSIVCESLSENNTPSEHEIEIYRIAGCKGNELKTAARCLHRRNVKQINEHRNHARRKFLHALVEMEENVNDCKEVSLMNSEQARGINESLLRLYTNAIEILSLIEDKNAVEAVTRLLDKTSARLQMLEAESINNKQEVIGEEECLHTVRRHLAQTSQ